MSVVGSFNDWEPGASPMHREPNGHWFANVEHAKIGDEYKIRITNGENTFDRIDPRACESTNSVGVGVVHDPNFDWDGDNFQMPNWNELVIYEAHIGTFHRSDCDQPGGFSDFAKKFQHLRRLGIDTIQIMPVAEFAGDISWGYNPAHVFAVESAYGGPSAFKHFVKDAHGAGLAVILDVVYTSARPI